MIRANSAPRQRAGIHLNASQRFRGQGGTCRGVTAHASSDQPNDTEQGVVEQPQASPEAAAPQQEPRDDDWSEVHDFQQCVVVLLGDCYGGNTLSEISVKFLAVKFLELQVLPDNLMGSLTQAAEATTYALTKGIERSTVEILLPEFWDPMSGAVFSEEGDQMRFWGLARKFSDDLIGMTKSSDVTVIFPDIGVAAYLRNAWEDAGFRITSLNDRTPVTGTEDLVIMAAPDPPGAEDCVRVNRMVPADTPLVLLNPRIVSGDVGVGLNVRRLRNQFLAQFITTYSIRPIDDIGTIFRKYPEQWQVYIQDETTPGRYKKIADRPERPAGDALDMLLDDAMGGATNEDGEAQDPGLVQQIARNISSLSRFMRSLQN